MSETIVGSGSDPEFDVDQFVEIAQGPLDEPPKFEHDLGYVIGSDVEVVETDILDGVFGQFVAEKFESWKIPGQVHYVVAFGAGKQGIYPEECLVPRHVGCGPKRVSEPTARDMPDVVDGRVEDDILDEPDKNNGRWIGKWVRALLPWI